jgi:EpsI family protein
MHEAIEKRDPWISAPASIKRRALVLAGLSIAGLALAETLKPRQLLARTRSGYDYELLVPHAFGEWREINFAQGQIVDPSLIETINRFYTQTVTRAYTGGDESLLMFSLAYGEVQNDEMRIHLPEVCYAAQGFDIKPLGERTVSVDRLSVPVNTAVATLGTRKEMVSYFVKVGDTLVGRGTRRKFAQMEYSLKGVIPDGLLVRVSSLDGDAEHAFGQHRRFITQLFEGSGLLGRQAIFGRQPI